MHFGMPDGSLMGPPWMCLVILEVELRWEAVARWMAGQSVTCMVLYHLEPVRQCLFLQVSEAGVMDVLE